MAELRPPRQGDQPGPQGRLPLRRRPRPIIPDLIEIGIDVLNPIQPACMDPAELKREYGDQLASGARSTSSTRCPSARPTTCATKIALRLRHHRRGRRADHGPDPPRPARHAAGELLGHGRHDPGDRLLIDATSVRGLRAASVGYGDRLGRRRAGRRHEAMALPAGYSAMREHRDGASNARHMADGGEPGDGARRHRRRHGDPGQDRAPGPGRVPRRCADLRRWRE